MMYKITYQNEYGWFFTTIKAESRNEATYLFYMEHPNDMIEEIMEVIDGSDVSQQG